MFQAKEVGGDQGSVWGLSGLDEQVTDTYQYEAFGSLISEDGVGTPNAYRYTGEQWDEHLGHYYLRARYYEPDRGRFWTMDSFEGFMNDPQSLHKYLYAHGNPVMFWDPSGNFSLSQVMVGVSVASIFWSTAQFALNRDLASGGLLALDLFTAGLGGKALLIAKGVMAARAAKHASTLARAFSGGKKALDAYRFRLVSTVLGTYDEIYQGIRAAGGIGIFQANHLNQLAAFRDIPRHLGLAIPLEGSAKIAGTAHHAFHKSMDTFWKIYRGTPLRPDEMAYSGALFEALQSAGVYGNDAYILAEAAVKQAKHFGYFGGGKLIRIPFPTT